MTYMENTYVCLAAPLILAILGLKGSYKRGLIFLLCGMTTCLMSAYISSYFAVLSGTDAVSATHSISPAVEEILKFLPTAFYLQIFEPKKKAAISGIISIAVGFATFENVCYLTSYGTSDIVSLLIRGFGTGAMHVLCGMMVSLGLFFLWDKTWVRMVGTFAVLCFAVTFHAIFNIMVSEDGISLSIGSAIPLAVILIYTVYTRIHNINIWTE